jgi:hypothetical protein
VPDGNSRVVLSVVMAGPSRVIPVQFIRRNGFLTDDMADVAMLDFDGDISPPGGSGKFLEPRDEVFVCVLRRCRRDR